MACKIVQAHHDPIMRVYQQRELGIWYKACRGARNVAMIYDAAYNARDGTAYIYMELLPGGDTWNLGGKIVSNGDVMHPLLLTTIAYQTALGLAEIHGRKLQHRDLKPDNILLTKKITPGMNKALWELERKGRPSSAHRDDLVEAYNILREPRLAVLTDFGLAHDHAAPAANHGIATKMGGFSAAYNAPEMVEGNNDQSPWADVFSFGLCIYMLSTMRFLKHHSERGNLPKTYSSDLQRLYLGCTQEDWERRPIAIEAASKLQEIQKAEMASIAKLYTAWKASERSAPAAQGSSRPVASSSRGGGGGGGMSAEHKRLIAAEMAQVEVERKRDDARRAAARGGGGGARGGTGGVTEAMGRLRVADDRNTRNAGNTPYYGGTSQQQGTRPAARRPEDASRRVAQGQSTRTGGGGSSRDYDGYDRYRR
ncbi:kinase-like domain-containing protein [Chaetomium strumarium]|uniref:Kinase-like domain-containing protein n=1 Tax=Chaetomium strumarium TaxID=1170767 RepID=A0AAJ0LYU0_9PEZI|nr:kinase-like domain-containing protein [Chaetomium strumarium]